MADTIKIIFSEAWTEITGLTTGVTYDFQNVNTADLFLQQAPSQPDAKEVGNRIVPSASVAIIKEATAVWVRSKTSKGVAFYNERDAGDGSGGGSGGTFIIAGVTDTSSPQTVTIQTADIAIVDQLFIVKDESGGAGTNNITVATQGSETIDGVASVLIIANYGVARLYSNGTNLFSF